MTNRNRFWRVDASPSDSVANGSGAAGRLRCVWGLVPYESDSDSCGSDNAAGEGLFSHRDWSGVDQGVLGLDGPERVPQELRMCFVLGRGNCSGGVCAIFC